MKRLEAKAAEEDLEAILGKQTSVNPHEVIYRVIIGKKPITGLSLSRGDLRICVAAYSAKGARSVAERIFPPSSYGIIRVYSIR